MSMWPGGVRLVPAAVHPVAIDSRRLPDNGRVMAKRVLLPGLAVMLAPALLAVSSHATARTDAPAPSGGTLDIPGRTALAIDSGGGRMWIQMRNVDLHINETQALGVRMLRGEVVRAKPDVPAALDDSKSFTVRVTRGEVTLTGDALAALLNDFVFAYPGAPLKHLHARTDGSRVVLRGTMHKGVDLPF